MKLLMLVVALVAPLSARAETMLPPEVRATLDAFVAYTAATSAREPVTPPEESNPAENSNSSPQQ